MGYRNAGRFCAVVFVFIVQCSPTQGGSSSIASGADRDLCESNLKPDATTWYDPYRPSISYDICEKADGYSAPVDAGGNGKWGYNKSTKKSCIAAEEAANRNQKYCSTGRKSTSKVTPASKDLTAAKGQEKSAISSSSSSNDEDSDISTQSTPKSTTGRRGPRAPLDCKTEPKDSVAYRLLCDGSQPKNATATASDSSGDSFDDSSDASDPKTAAGYHGSADAAKQFASASSDDPKDEKLAIQRDEYPTCTNGSNTGGGFGWDTSVTDSHGSHSCRVPPFDL
jgi:hypothetical protein